MQFQVISLYLLTLSASASALSLPAANNAVARDEVVEVTVNVIGTKAADGALAVEDDVAGTFNTLAQRRDEVAAAIEKRSATVVILTTVGTAALTKAAEMAVDYAAGFLKNLNNWTKAREEFTKDVTLQMWNKNPNVNAWPAVACYNKGYHVANPSGVGAKVSAELKLGALNTDYDCLYLSGNNAFYTHSDGGYINLAYRYNGNRCSFDKKTGDLTCK